MGSLLYASLNSSSLSLISIAGKDFTSHGVILLSLSLLLLGLSLVFIFVSLISKFQFLFLRSLPGDLSFGILFIWKLHQVHFVFLFIVLGHLSLLYASLNSSSLPLI